MNKIDTLLINVKKMQKQFVNEELILIIKKTVINMFPNLNSIDIDILNILTIFLIDLISYKYHFKNSDEYFEQWKNKNNRDIKRVVLLLLPFINDKDDNYLLKKLTDLNELLYKYPNQNIKKSILLREKKEILKIDFEFGNMAIGLINNNTNDDIILDLIKPYKLIYEIIYNNFLATIQTLEIMNAKYYINWINIVPLRIDNYKQSELYISTKKAFMNKDINNFSLYYSGLWIGDFYNIFRIKFYEEIKNIYWLIELNDKINLEKIKKDDLIKLLDSDILKESFKQFKKEEISDDYIKFLQEQYNLLKISSYYKFLDKKKKIKEIFNYAKLISNDNDIELDINYVSLTSEQKVNFLKKFDNNKYLDLVFEEMIYNGLLNEFRVNLKVNIIDYFDKNKNDWSKAYYYLSNEPFSKVPKQNEKTYFDFIATEQKWFLFYAMDWICQIDFFKHFIYNQVLYITGATGQGKSTQVPKLLLYASKVIDYKSDSNVICTEPRQIPTESNANRIASELGFPLDKKNYYVQFKHKNNKYINPNFIKNNLKIVTDGTLFVENKTNIIMKEMNDNKYINKNVYDIIIIDEAHEHGVNMDLLLSLGKETCYLNNQIRLIITSATMDDDDPIYRRFYHDINDKLLFPIKNRIIEPFSKDEILIETKYLDRRFHISPPGETTQYLITEKYLEDELESQEEIIEKSISISLNICKDIKGHILLFTTGSGEIRQIVEKLNRLIPDYVVALPLYGELNENYKKIITNISNSLSLIKTNKLKIHETWNENYKNENSNSGIKNTYKYAIIVATNIAEASVTIPDLLYVIDNGYSRTNFYHREISKEKLVLDKISENSRIQRKGRVGRVGSGTVYFLYKKNGRRDIKSKYKITQEDVSYTLLELLTYKTINNIKMDNKYNIITLNKFNPNRYESLKNEISDKYYIKSSGLYDIYLKNYKINNNFLGIEYYNKNDNNYIIYNDGHLFEDILDINGNFNIIHPFELSIKRNILNQIIEYNNNKTSKIPINDFKYMINNLVNKNLLVDINYNISCFNINSLSITSNFVKTELSKDIFSIKDTLDIFSDNSVNLLVLVSGYIFDCFEEIYEILTCLKSIRYINELINMDLVKYKKLYNLKYNSDLIFIHDIINKIKNNRDNIEQLCKNNNLKKNKITNIKKNLLKMESKDFKQFKNQFNIFDEFKANFRRELITNDIYEKIIKSFIFGNPQQIAFNDGNKKITILNLNKFEVIYDKSIVNISNDLFYYNDYELNDDNKLELKFINYVDPKWLISILPLYYNKSLLKLNIKSNNFVDIIINNFKENSNVWDSKRYEILKNHFNHIIKKII